MKQGEYFQNNPARCKNLTIPIFPRTFGLEAFLLWPFDGYVFNEKDPTTIKVESRQVLFVLLEKARKDQKDILEGNTNDNLYCRY